MELSSKEKRGILRNITWDYNVPTEDLLAVINGEKKSAGPFTAEKLLVRCLERISWHRIVALWGIDTILRIYKPEILYRLRSKELRRRYDIVFKTLRKEPLPSSSWGSEYHKKLQHTFLSDRRYSAQQRIL